MLFRRKVEISYEDAVQMPISLTTEIRSLKSNGKLRALLDLYGRQTLNEDLGPAEKLHCTEGKNTAHPRRSIPIVNGHVNLGCNWQLFHVCHFWSQWHFKICTYLLSSNLTSKIDALKRYTPAQISLEGSMVWTSSSLSSIQFYVCSICDVRRHYN